MCPQSLLGFGTIMPDSRVAPLAPFFGKGGDHAGIEIEPLPERLWKKIKHIGDRARERLGDVLAHKAMLNIRISTTSSIFR